MPLGARVPDDDPPGELGFQVRAQRYQNRATANMQLAEAAAVPNVRDRYLRIAEYYVELTLLEQRVGRRYREISSGCLIRSQA